MIHESLEPPKSSLMRSLASSSFPVNQFHHESLPGLGFSGSGSSALESGVVGGDGSEGEDGLDGLDGELGFTGTVGLEGDAGLEGVGKFGGPVPVSGKSSGTSSVGASLSVCNPTGFSGSRRVPLFEFGWRPRESQRML